MKWKGVLVYAENYSGKVHESSYELLGKARELVSKLGGKVYAVLLSSNENDFAKDLIAYGADEVHIYMVDNALLPNQLVHRDAIVSLIKEIKPRLVLFPATPWGRSLGPRIAARLRVGITADCLDIYIDDQGEIIQVRPAFTGNLIAHIKTLSYPVIATIRPKVFPTPKPDYSRNGKVYRRYINSLSSDVDKVKVIGKPKVKQIRLADADIIVSIGKGVKSREDIKIFEDFARELGGILASSRPLVDMGWMDRDRQVGFSGNIVRPKIYIALGISGAPQHIAGMKDSEVVISINIDPSAPIAKYSDLFVVGDIYEIVPKLLDEIRKIRLTRRT